VTLLTNSVLSDNANLLKFVISTVARSPDGGGTSVPKIQRYPLEIQLSTEEISRLSENTPSRVKYRVIRVDKRSEKTTSLHLVYARLCLYEKRRIAEWCRSLSMSVCIHYTYLSMLVREARDSRMV